SEESRSAGRRRHCGSHLVRRHVDRLGLERHVHTARHTVDPEEVDGCGRNLSMGLNVETAMRITPDSITKAGGQSIAMFAVTATGADTHEKTVYSIPAELPYIFANASDPADD